LYELPELIAKGVYCTLFCLACSLADISEWSAAISEHGHSNHFQELGSKTCKTFLRTKPTDIPALTAGR
jgi:hypothetical protein